MRGPLPLSGLHHDTVLALRPADGSADEVSRFAAAASMVCRLAVASSTSREQAVQDARRVLVALDLMAPARGAGGRASA